MNTLMTYNTKFALAATELLKRRVKGTKARRLNINLRPQNIDDALNIQSQMVEQYDGTVGGWKCLLPFDDKIIVAPIFSNTIQNGPECKLFKDQGAALIEPEIAFILNKNLPAKDTDYSEDEINSAIGNCHMALELIQSRFADDSGAEFPEIVADLIVNQGLFIGPEIDRDQAFSASHINLTISQGDNIQTFEGAHPNPLPHLPIYWLVNFMSKRGVTFKKGDAIITGSYAGVVALKFNIETTISYENIGEYKVTFLED
jgi:2-keto-4-pentenoate hydratase